MIETKGQENIDVAHKDRAATIWCENATLLTDVTWSLHQGAAGRVRQAPAKRSVRCCCRLRAAGRYSISVSQARNPADHCGPRGWVMERRLPMQSSWASRRARKCGTDDTVTTTTAAGGRRQSPVTSHAGAFMVTWGDCPA